MSPWFSFAIACFALLVSGVTAWLTFFRKGKLVMTQPTVIFFGPDGSKFESSKKAFLPVLKNGKYFGFISKSEALEAYREKLQSLIIE